MTGSLASLSPATVAALGFAAGLVLGLFHFATLGRVAVLFSRRSGVARALGLQLVRFAILVAVLAAVAQGGALPLLAAAAGLTIGRVVVFRRLRGAA